jgi:hypothetical protein
MGLYELIGHVLPPPVSAIHYNDASNGLPKSSCELFVLLMFDAKFREYDTVKFEMVRI